MSSSVITLRIKFVTYSLVYFIKDANVGAQSGYNGNNLIFNRTTADSIGNKKSFLFLEYYEVVIAVEA